MTKRDGWIRVSLEMGAGLFVVIASAALFNIGGWVGNPSQVQAVYPVPQYDISVDKTANPDPEVLAGTVLTYTVKVSNVVSSTDAVDLTDVINPGNVGVVQSFMNSNPATWSCNVPAAGAPATGFSCINQTGMPPVTNGLPPGAMDTFTMVLNIPSSVPDGTVMVNTATAKPGDCMYMACDTNPGNDSDVITTTVKTQADLVFDKTVAPQGPIFQGTPLTYTLTVTNNGPSDAQDVMIVDTIPSGAALVFFTVSSGGTCGTMPAVGDSGPVKCTWSGPTPPGTTHSLVIVVRACEKSPCGELTNAASSSSSTFDPNGSNDTDTVETLILPVPAPVLSPTGLFLAVLALFAVGGWALHRRRLAPH